MATTTPSFVAEKRARKAQRIANALMANGFDAEAAAHLDADGRRDAEAAAGVRHPGSDQTWRAVVTMLAGSNARVAQCPTCGIGAPDGVAGPPKSFGHVGPCAR